MRNLVGLVLLMFFACCGLLRAQTKPVFERILSFDGTNGDRPLMGLTLGNDGNLYGTTAHGGANDMGTIFKMTPQGTLTTLFSFDGNNGYLPAGELVQGPDGWLYGATVHGGKDYDSLHKLGNGTIFKINTDGTGFTNLYFFSGANDRGCGLALGPDGDLYGMLQWGGKTGWGMIYKISTDGGFRTVFSLDDTTGYGPENSLLLGRDGNWYGTLATGGKYDGGNFFRLATNRVFTVLASFDGKQSFHVGRNQLVQGADGDFYGTTEFGGAHDSKFEDGVGTGDGTLYKVATNGSVTTLASFNGANGAHPRGQLVQAGDGSFYGVTINGVGSLGTIFRATTNGEVTTVFRFTAPDFEYSMTNGSSPCGLVLDPPGNFYGTTILGGAKAYLAGYAMGTIFKFRP